MKKGSFFILTILMMPFLQSCQKEDVGALIAQCEIDAGSEKGKSFIKNWQDTQLEHGTDKIDPDVPYRNWVITCMKAKGYKFGYGQDDLSNCYVDALKSLVDEEKCYTKN